MEISHEKDTHMTMSTHYCIAILDRGGLARGMYTRSCAYATPELARSLGPSDPHLGPGDLALVQVETVPDRDGSRRLVRELILDTVARG